MQKLPSLPSRAQEALTTGKFKEEILDSPTGSCYSLPPSMLNMTGGSPEAMDHEMASKSAFMELQQQGMAGAAAAGMGHVGHYGIRSAYPGPVCSQPSQMDTFSSAAAAQPRPPLAYPFSMNSMSSHSYNLPSQTSHHFAMPPYQSGGMAGMTTGGSMRDGKIQIFIFILLYLTSISLYLTAIFYTLFIAKLNGSPNILSSGDSFESFRITLSQLLLLPEID